MDGGGDYDGGGGGYGDSGGTDYSNYNTQDPGGGFSPNSIHSDDKYGKDDDYGDKDFRNYQETDVDQIILETDTSHPDGAIRYIVPTLGDFDEKPPLNGDVPSSNLLSKDNDNGNLGNFEQPHDDGCGVDCMHYALLCCECSIL